jgi:hypothetical protein
MANCKLFLVAGGPLACPSKAFQAFATLSQLTSHNLNRGRRECVGGSRCLFSAPNLVLPMGNDPILPE